MSLHGRVGLADFSGIDFSLFFGKKASKVISDGCLLGSGPLHGRTTNPFFESGLLAERICSAFIGCFTNLSDEEEVEGMH